MSRQGWVIPSVLPYHMKPRTSNNDSHSYICLNGVKPIKPDVANLSVTTHGSVFWNDERMGDEQLAQRLQASAPRQPQPEDFIRGDRLVGPPARRPGVGFYAEVRVLKLSFVTDPGSDRVSRKTPS